MTTPSPSPIITAPGVSRVIDAFGDRMHLHLDGSQTAGSFTLFTLETPPGNGPPLHIHDRESETFYVIEGSVEFFRDGQWAAVPPGSVVHMPVGSRHTFRNTGRTTLKLLIQTAPSGFENFFAQCAEVFAGCGPDNPPDMQKLIAISESFGIHLLV